MKHKRTRVAKAKKLLALGALFAACGWDSTLAAAEKDLPAGAPSCGSTPSTRALAQLVANDLRAPVRPGGVDGQEFWNAHSEWFMYPPSFAFLKVAGASRYRFTVLDDQHVSHTFEAETPEATLAPVWAQMPTGFVSVRCDALDADGRVVGLAGERTRFWKQAPYRPGAYPPAKRGYREAARLIYDYVFMRPSTRYLLSHGKPDYSYSRNAYPSKMGAALICAMVRYAKMRPDRAEEAMKIAQLQADYLISVSQPAAAPLPFFPPTYAGDKLAARGFKGENMLLYPATVAKAYLVLAAATGVAKYDDAARAIGETYLRLQGADGTWTLKVREKDGAPVTRNRAFPMVMMELFAALEKKTGDRRWREAADRAFAFIERGPLADWNWEGQFEDVIPTEKYVNLTKHPACSTAMYLLTRYPGDAQRLAQARELLRFSEDQFVCWERPCRPDGIGPRWHNRPDEKKWVQNDYLDWVVPAVTEQYQCYHPIDASAAKLIDTYLALHAATGSALDLAKAKTLADSIVNVQDPDGRLPTHWNISRFSDRDYDWINCMIAAANALERLADVLDSAKVGQSAR